MYLSIPSPVVAAWHVGPLLIRAYALCILLGIVVAVWLTGRRLEQRGIPKERALDVAAFGVPFGIVGARLYSVITTPQPYFGVGGNPWRIFAIWEGGLGIWGAVALGAVGAWIGCRRLGVPFPAFLDSAAPAVALAQAIGRWGNWFNNELHGGPTTKPWGLVIHQWNESTGRAVLDAKGHPIVLGTFQPTFLYESVFLVVLTVVLLVLDRRRRFSPYQITALYIAGYPIGRVVVELLRDDFANKIFGLRVNVWMSMVVFALGVVLYVWAGRRHVPESETAPTAS